MKPAAGIPIAPQPTKIATPPLTGIGKSQFHYENVTDPTTGKKTMCVFSAGSKAAPVGIGSKPGGIGSAAAGQPPAEGENVLTKILQGGAAEQAGKLGDGTLINSIY